MTSLLPSFFSPSPPFSILAPADAKAEDPFLGLFPDEEEAEEEKSLADAAWACCCCCCCCCCELPTKPEVSAGICFGAVITEEANWTCEWKTPVIFL